MDEGNAKNYNYRSDNSGNINNNDARDSNSSNSDKGNKAYGCIGQWGSLAPIYSRLKPKRTIKQWSYLSPLILSIYISN
jgi:hypothetical protein